MEKSKILKELVNNEVSLEIALSRLMIIANDIEDNEVSKWAEDELNGYKKGNIPPYRILGAGNIYYSGINGRYNITHASLPIDIFSNDIRKALEESPMLDSINSLTKLTNAEHAIAKDITALSEFVFETQGIQCTKITMEYGSNQITNILSAIRTKLISIFIELDKRLGNLDDLDISTENVNLPELRQTIFQIIYQDNSVKIGDKNKIDDTKLIGGDT